jgi:hypothetical protein
MIRMPFATFFDSRDFRAELIRIFLTVSTRASVNKRVVLLRRRMMPSSERLARTEVSSGRRTHHGQAGAVRLRGGLLQRGGLQGQDFRLDIEGEDISEEVLARYIVQDMRLLMVEEVRILNKEIIAERQKRPEPS